MSEIMRQIWTPQMQMAFTIVVLLIVCLYALSIVWISRDARLRGESPMKWMIVGLIPGAGIIAYLLLRPPMLAMDRDEQELEVALKQRELMRYGECVKCGYPVKDDYVLCPNCQTQLRNLCHGCGKPLEPSWPVCPYCTTPVQSRQNMAAPKPQSKPQRRNNPQAERQSTRPSSSQSVSGGSSVARSSGSSSADRSSARTPSSRSSRTSSPASVTGSSSTSSSHSSPHKSVTGSSSASAESAKPSASATITSKSSGTAAKLSVRPHSTSGSASARTSRDSALSTQTRSATQKTN